LARVYSDVRAQVGADPALTPEERDRFLAYVERREERARERAVLEAMALPTITSTSGCVSVTD